MNNAPDILRTSTTAAVADPVTKRHVQKMADATALALATSSGKHSAAFRTQLQTLEKQDRAFGFRRQQEQLQHGSHRGRTTQVEDQSLQTAPQKFNFQTKVSKNLLDETALILNPQFLGNVAAQYQPQPPPAFIPVSTILSSKKNANNNNRTSSGGGGKKKKRRSSSANSHTITTTSVTSDGSDYENAANGSSNSPKIAPDTLPAAIETSIPPLDTAAPARNLCVELLSTRVVSCVKAVSLLLQEHSSSPGQSLPHVAVLGAGNVGRTILNHLVKLLPADRIAILARDAKSEVCNHFSTKYGVRALSTNILKDERLVDVIKSHRSKLIEEALNKQRDAGLVSASSSQQHASKKNHQPFFSSTSSSTNNNTASQIVLAMGGGDSPGGENNNGNSHVAPEVAAAQNISLALQQVHVLIICCRPAQLSEVASSLQPWLRSSSVVVLSTLVGVTADRVAALFRVPSSLSVTVDTNDMIFDFETRSRLHARAQENAAAAATLIGNLQQHTSGGNNNNNNNNLESSFRSNGGGGGGGGGNNNNSTSVVGALMHMNRAEEALSPVSVSAQDSSDYIRSLSLLEIQKHIAEHQNHQFRFFTREPLDFLHRLFFALVSTLLERCGVGPAESWMAVAKLFLGNNNDLQLGSKYQKQQRSATSPMKKREGFTIVAGSFIQLPKGIGAQGPSLVAKCSMQVLASAAGISVGEAVRIIDERMVGFAGF